LDLLEFLEGFFAAEIAKEKFCQREHAAAFDGDALSLKELLLLGGDCAIEAHDAMAGAVSLMLSQDRAHGARGDGIAQREGDLAERRDFALRNLSDQLESNLFDVGQGEHRLSPMPIISLGVLLHQQGDGLAHEL
jgi:hypothetical protein